MPAQPNTPPTPPATAQPPPASMSLDDILFTIFRHKWLVLVCFCCGIGAAIVVRAMRPPQFISHAKLQVHYVEERGPAPGTEPGHVVQLMPAVQGILNVEKEIIRNLDVATAVASNIGPQRLLAKNGGGDDLMNAAGLVCGSVEVEVPQQIPLLIVSFRHRDRSLVQQTVGVLIDAYLKKHNEMHGFSPELEAFYEKQRKELSEQFAKTQAELTELLSSNRIISLSATKEWLQAQRSKWKDQLTEAEVELDTHKAILGESAQAAFAPGSTNIALKVPDDKVEQYTRLMDQLNHYKLKEQELRLHDPPYTDAHPTMLAVHGQLEMLGDEKAKLVKAFPALEDLPIASAHSSSNSAASSLNTDLAQIKMLNQKVIQLKNVVTNLDQELTAVLKAEPDINKLTLDRDLQATNLEHFAQSLDIEKVTQSLGAGKTVNISILEKPTPPELDRGKMMKLVVGAFGGFVAMGLGLAFLIDFVLDRSIKRPIDIERHLKLKVLQSIPHTNWSGGLRLPWGKNGGSALAKSDANGANGHTNTGMALWDPTHHLDAYTMGLSERLMTYFEVNDKNLKKPKLVGFTACARGSGVTTLASGLAASLSRTGNGSVLFVDMNSENGETQSFYQGKPSVGLTDALEPGDHTDAQIETNLFVATLDDNNSNKLVKAEPRGFSVLMPKIKTSDYDYIIFDLPPVSQTSSSARLAGYMDLTLLVLESEKTGQQAAAKATALMRDARANVATVLNKCRQHVPAMLSQDL